MSLRLLFVLLCCLAGAAHAEPARTTSPKAYLTLIIDDLGQNLPRDRRVLALPGPVTTAIMPDTPHATEFAREAHRAGKIVILHMPMDPATGPYAWHPELPLEELQKQVVPNVTYLQIHKQTKTYRGDVVRFRGIMRRAWKNVATNNPWGLQEYYVIWIHPIEGPNAPIIIHLSCVMVVAPSRATGSDSSEVRSFMRPA